MKKASGFLLALLLATVPAFAAGIDGTWTGSIDTQNGPVMVSYTFKVSGTTLTGSTMGPDGSVIPIKNGMIDGAKISFSIDLNFGGNATTLTYTGTVSPGQISLTTSFMGQPMSFTVKKTS
jgi:hypothetical protein